MRFDSRNNGKQNNSMIKTLIILIIVLFSGFSVFFYGVVNKSLNLDVTVNIKTGDTFSKFLGGLSYFDRLGYKTYIKLKNVDMSDIKPGIYELKGNYSKSKIIDLFKKGPDQNYVQVSVLEGWSIYDIDDYLTSKGYIKSGEYISKVTDIVSIQELAGKYSFYKEVKSDLSRTKTLEGFLYPDTYFIDPSKDYVTQIIDMQLKQFDEKVYLPNKKLFETFSQRTKRVYGIELNVYDAIILASIVEKEEKNYENKKIVGAIFLNRLSKDRRIDADITLCYGLKVSYDRCTPDLIGEKIRDSSGGYNTRVVKGLTPSPIANPHLTSFTSIIDFQKTDYMFYLHDGSGNIHPAVDNAGHCQNKLEYLGRGC